jgi:hypothetical protein
MNKTSFFSASVSPIDESRLTHKQTVEEYLASGKRITQCPPRRAIQSLDGAAVIDGYTISTITVGSEAIPQLNRVSVKHYDDGLAEAIQPLHHLAWQDIERESVPSSARFAMDYRPADADEINEDW